MEGSSSQYTLEGNNIDNFDSVDIIDIEDQNFCNMDTLSTEVENLKEIYKNLLETIDNNVRVYIEQGREQLAVVQSTLEGALKKVHMEKLSIDTEIKQLNLERSSVEKELEDMEKSMRYILPDNEDDILEINIGGKIIQSTKTTLCCLNGSTFNMLFLTENDELRRDSDGILFVDLNPNIFAIILDYLREKKSGLDVELPYSDDPIVRQKIRNMCKILGIPHTCQFHTIVDTIKIGSLTIKGDMKKNVYTSDPPNEKFPSTTVYEIITKWENAVFVGTKNNGNYGFGWMYNKGTVKRSDSGKSITTSNDEHIKLKLILEIETGSTPRMILTTKDGFDCRYIEDVPYKVCIICNKSSEISKSLI